MKFRTRFMWQASEWIGLAAPDAIAKMLACDEAVRNARFFAAPAGSVVQNRVSMRSDSTPVINEALMIRDRCGVPFWDAVISLSQERFVPEELRRQALHHNTAQDRVWNFPVSEMLADLVRGATSELTKGEVLVFSSVVECHDIIRKHVPMLDLRWRFTPDNQQIVEVMLGDLGVAGLLLKSGNSFHFYGAELLTDEELVRFLGRALLCGPMIDRRWVAHQLIERSCGLRVSRGAGDQADDEPVVVGIVRSQDKRCGTSRSSK